jgi:glutamyl-tRNA reductase
MLEQLGAIGISWREDGSEALADYAIAEDRLAESLTQFADDNRLAEIAYLSTCNRVEIFFLRAESRKSLDLRPAVFELLCGRVPQPGEAQRRLKAWAGEGAAEHLFLVTAALDSACVGEVEVAGQVRKAHELALELGHCGAALDLLFNEAYRVMGQVRGETRISAGRVSLAEIAVDQIKARHTTNGGIVALVGVSPMTTRAAVSLQSAKIPFIVVNRTLDNAQALAEPYAAPSMSLEEFRRKPPPVESVLCCTGAPAAVVDKSCLIKIVGETSDQEPPLLIDMSVPPDIDVSACAEMNLERIGMDQIVAIAESNRGARDAEVANAREIVDQALASLGSRYADKYFGPLFGALQKRYSQIAQDGVDRLLKKELPDLSEQQRSAVTAWSVSLAKRFAHLPCAGLRGLMHDGPEGSLDAFIDGLDPKFANDLRRATVESNGSTFKTVEN